MEALRGAMKRRKGRGEEILATLRTRLPEFFRVTLRQ